MNAEVSGVHRTLVRCACCALDVGGLCVLRIGCWCVVLVAHWMLVCCALDFGALAWIDRLPH